MQLQGSCYFLTPGAQRLCFVNRARQAESWPILGALFVLFYVLWRRQRCRRPCVASKGRLEILPVFLGTKAMWDTSNDVGRGEWVGRDWELYELKYLIWCCAYRELWGYCSSAILCWGLPQLHVSFTGLFFSDLHQGIWSCLYTCIKIVHHLVLIRNETYNETSNG